MRMCQLCARVAQWIRRCPPKAEIAGSSPAVSTNLLMSACDEHGGRGLRFAVWNLVHRDEQSHQRPRHEPRQHGSRLRARRGRHETTRQVGCGREDHAGCARPGRQCPERIRRPSFALARGVGEAQRLQLKPINPKQNNYTVQTLTNLLLHLKKFL